MTTPDPRAAALADLREWAENQATARQRLIAAAWRAGVRNVAELSRVAGVSRDTVYDDLRRENIDPTKRSAMPTSSALSRRAQVREHLSRIVAATPLLAPRELSPDRAAVDHQIEQVNIMNLLYGPDEVADAYTSWLDASLAEQAKTATALTSWSDLPMSVSPLPRWGRDRHGFLCVIACDERFWQVLRVGDASIERMCKQCGRDELGLDASEVWAPRLPAIHGHVAFPGLLPDEPRDNLLQVQWNGKPDNLDYVMGEANAFLVEHGWMDMTADAGPQLAGEVETPTLEASGRINKPGHEFAWTASFTYDPAPQGWRKSPYGFRLVTGTLSSAAGVSTFDDGFQMLDAVAVGTGRGEQ